MKSLSNILIIITYIWLLLGCSENEFTSRNYPRLNTLDVSNISENGATFNARILYRGDFKIVNYGFVWSGGVNPKIEWDDKVVYSENYQSDTFSSEIFSALKDGGYYRVRAFIETEDYTVYGENVTFISLGSKAPIMTSFSPLSGSWGDTITIVGERFSFVERYNEVMLGKLPCLVLKSSDTLVKFKVPNRINDASVKVTASIHGMSTQIQDNFNYLIANVSIIEPLSGTFNDTVTITGSNFSHEKVFNHVHFNEFEAKIISSSTSEIKCLVPEKLINEINQIRITSDGNTIQFNKDFILKP